jgi:hypothetical protein
LTTSTTPETVITYRDLETQYATGVEDGGGLATISYYFKTYVDKFRSRVLASWSCYDFVKFLTPAEKRELLKMKEPDQETNEINKDSGAEEGVGGDGSGAGKGGDNNGSNVSIGGGNASC